MAKARRLGIIQYAVDYLLLFKGFLEVIRNEVPDDAKIVSADYDLPSQTFRILFETEDERFPVANEAEPVTAFVTPVLRRFSGEALERLALQCWERLSNQDHFRCRLCNAVKEILDPKLRVLIGDLQQSNHVHCKLGDPVPPGHWHTDSCPIGLVLKDYGSQLTYYDSSTWSVSGSE